MMVTMEGLNEAILFFADKYNKKKQYYDLLRWDLNLREIIKMILFDMFLYSFDELRSDDEYEMMKIIHDYVKKHERTGNDTVRQEY